MSIENDVRDAAVKLADAIVAARAAGYRIDWPSTFDGLRTIPVSETAAVKKEEPPPAPKTFGKREA